MAKHARHEARAPPGQRRPAGRDRRLHERRASRPCCNRLTGADVLVADQLFATLDPTVRRLKLPGGRRCTVSDTVGFVSKLPHDLVEAFRSTLEEVTMAELIVHVADAASPDLGEQIEAVRRVLGEIGAGDVPEVLVLNKIDRLQRLGAGTARAPLPGLGARSRR